jgi:hypothetical protein
VEIVDARCHGDAQCAGMGGVAEQGALRHNACLVAVAPQLACAAEWDCFST